MGYKRRQGRKVEDALGQVRERMRKEKEREKKEQAQQKSVLRGERSGGGRGIEEEK